MKFDKDWLLSQLERELKWGISYETYYGDKEYYLVVSKIGKVLIVNEIPSKDEYSINMYMTAASRSVDSPKTERQHRNTMSDYRSSYIRKVVAANNAKGLPNVDDYIADIRKNKIEIICK
jgi:hypothetical protein